MKLAICSSVGFPGGPTNVPVISFAIYEYSRFMQHSFVDACLPHKEWNSGYIHDYCFDSVNIYKEYSFTS